MLIALGLFILCIVFVVFGSKEEEASVLYYDMEDAPEGNAGLSVSVEDGDVVAPPLRQKPVTPPSAEVGVGRLADDRPAEVAPGSEGQQAADIANQIYNDITL